MVGALVGGAFLSGFVNVVFDRLLSPEVASLIRGKKLDQKLIERLKTTLCAVEAVLNDAERKQINDLAVKKWLDDLRDAVYVADDLLDCVTSQAATKSEVSNFFSSFLILNSRDRKVICEIEDITGRLEYIVSFKDTLGLKEIPTENFSWRTSTSLLQGSPSDIYGRDQDKDNIMKLLLDDNGEDTVSVIPIWGMGGVGKTTLAQWLYNDKNLMENFDLSAWVCVSEESSIIHITKSIAAAINYGPCDVKDLNLLQLEVKEKLAGKKFFLVLDDVWNMDSHGWNSLRKPFQYGKKGSKVLVTTRSSKVASTVQTTPPYLLHELMDEYRWPLFAKHAHFLQSGGDPNLEKTGKDIVKRCQGLPLAIETLGCLLRTKHDMNTWNAVLKNEMWEFPIEDSKIIPALKISYHHLPSHLKRCFVYCSLFPKDFYFNKDDLILMWMAEDLLRPQRNGETPKEVGSECFDGLTSRSFFKRAKDDDNYFVMHDLMHDLAISVAGDFYFQADELGKINNIQLQTRHLSYERLNYPIKNNFDAIDKLKSLRTFLRIGIRNPSFSIENLALIVLSKFKYLRVLSFCCFRDLDIMPDSIGEMIHMRFLDFSFTGIKTLPESLCQLCNLETLMLSYCSNLVNLPSGMQNLANLQHLDVIETCLKEMPPGMSKLKQLQFLSNFVVGECEENGIKELGALSNIHGSLSLGNLENVTNSGDAEEASIKDKTQIKCLRLEWSSDKDMVSASHVEREILDNLQPHKGLEDITIVRYRGTRFPDWLGHSSYHRMTHVSLESCSNCCMLPSLGQLPCLKSLVIEGFDKVSVIDDEFYKTENDASSLETPFPSLEVLRFRNMSCWEEWRSPRSFAFPQLKELALTDCPSLKGDLPRHLPLLKRLEIRRCPKLIDLPDELPSLESLKIHGCEQLVCSLPNAPSIQKLSISNIKGVALQEFPISLHSLLVEGCQPVQSMLRTITDTQLTCVEYLTISDCSCALSISEDSLPENLKDLKIKNCKNIELPNQHKSLVSLRIENSCDLRATFSLGVFPNLKGLCIIGCLSLQSLSVSPLQSKASALHGLIIEDCPNFVRFPTEGLAAPNLTSFSLVDCPMLKSLPSHMSALIPNLDYLKVWDCPEIDAFPEGGLPPNLKTLTIKNCDNLLRRLSSMGVHVGLTSLYIVGASSESFNSFPMEGLPPQLPSLDSLYLRSFETMETLNCNGLLHLTSLQVLEISGCPKLNGFVGERLPLSLVKLQISNTPLLEEQCQKKHHQIWHKICHIPGIHVKDRWLSRC